MRRRWWAILCIAACAGALACLAAGVLSHHYQPVLVSEAGKPGFALGARMSDGRAFVSWKLAAERRPAWAGQINRLGFRYTRWSNGSGEVGVPLWLPSSLLVLFGFIAGAQHRRSRRGWGRCANCGYDLRASPQRCPECGTPVGAAAVPG
jgi:hypothetical protein